MGSNPSGGTNKYLMIDVEEQAWLNCHIDDLWIFDKLILSRKLGYVCGPVGVGVPCPGKYIVRPITNLLGMGREAEIVWLDGNTDHLIPGHFWCNIFIGRHLSVDYIDRQQTVCVEGFRRPDSPLYRWDRWCKVSEQIPFPSILKELKGEYKYINCEFIDERLVEVHLRQNPDFENECEYFIPVWQDQDPTPPEGMYFEPNPDFKRIGFFKHGR